MKRCPPEMRWQPVRSLAWVSCVGETRYLDAAARVLRAAWSGLEQYPHGHAAMLIALEEHLEPPSTVIIRGSASRAEEWRAELARGYSPSRLVFAIPADDYRPANEPGGKGGAR